MKLLLVLDGVDYPTAANPQLALRAAGALAGAGHTVHLLYLEDGRTPLPPPPAGCTAFHLYFADERRMNEALEHGNAGGAPAPLRLLRLAGRPDAALAAVRMLALRHPRRQAACQRELARLNALHHYDAAVAVAAPWHAAFALAKAAFGGIKAAWLMDPYSQNRERGTAPDPRLLNEEISLYRALDLVFVTRLMAPDYAPGGPFAAFAQKARVLEFPALVPAGPEEPAGPEGTCGPQQAPAPEGTTVPCPKNPVPDAPCAPGEEAPDAPCAPCALGKEAPDAPCAPGEEAPAPEGTCGPRPGGIRCVFVGNLYPALRTPEFALELFCALKDDALSLHFYGGGWEHFAPDSPVGRAAARAKEQLGDRFTVCGPLPPAAARREMARADVLLSLGNAVANQLPSKVFDYCGAGLPVLHLARRPDDPALAYFARWPLACCVDQSEGVTPELLARVGGFLHRAAGRRLPFETARRLFWENTPEAVAARMAGLLAEFGPGAGAGAGTGPDAGFDPGPAGG